MRDPTRGGLATVMHDVAQATGMRLEEAAIPLHAPVRGICEMLGYDPFYLASEGRIVAVVTGADAEQARSRWRALPDGAEAAIIGRIEGDGAQVILETAIRGERFLEELDDDPLPRIC